MKQNFGFVKVAAAIPALRVAHCSFNVTEIIRMAEKAEQDGVEIICFPELSITSSSCGDLFLNSELLLTAENALRQLLYASNSLRITIITGMPIRQNGKLYNCVVVINQGRIAGIVPQRFVSPKNRRWFSDAEQTNNQSILVADQQVVISVDLIFKCCNYSFSIEVGDDGKAPISTAAATAGVDIIFNPAADPELTGGFNTLRKAVSYKSLNFTSGYVYVSPGNGESTTDSVMTGNAIISETGEIIAESKRFFSESQLVTSEIDTEKTSALKIKSNLFKSRTQENNFTYIQIDKKLSRSSSLSRVFQAHPFIPEKEERNERYTEILEIQASALARRWEHTGLSNLVIGVSGGLDSTLAVLACVWAADKLGYSRSQIMGVTMPGFGTTERTYNNATDLMQALEIRAEEISIEKASMLHFEDIGHDPNVHDVIYENVQARERTKILMNLANKHNGLVIGTGNMSESALGWSTYNGDHMSMYAINIGVPKTVVRDMVAWYSEQSAGELSHTLQDILATPISPELLPADKKGEIQQKTEQHVGPYELHDFFLYHFVKYGFGAEKLAFMATNAFNGIYKEKEIRKWLSIFLQRFIQQQFKRSCSPDGPQVTEISLSPRGGWSMPSDATNLFKLKS